jgi:uncharacterized protein YndB with AHSA1/START domain
VKRANRPVKKDTPEVEALPAGTVRVSVTLAITPREAFVALTDRAAVAQWFGDLSASLVPGGPYRLDFGDGDFFEIAAVEADPPHALSYRWRFLGTGPSNEISWTIEPHGSGCRVAVKDREVNRDRKAVIELGEGWRDFLQRLQDHSVAGANTRYGWRREFDGSIELPIDAGAATALLLDPVGQRSWMPLMADAIRAGATATSRDGAHPDRFVIDSVSPAKSGLRFNLGCPEWLSPTECRIEIQERPSGALLVVAHKGWESIGAEDAEQSRQRQRFGRLWTDALHKAEQAAMAASRRGRA